VAPTKKSPGRTSAARAGLMYQRYVDATSCKGLLRKPALIAAMLADSSPARTRFARSGRSWSSLASQGLGDGAILGPCRCAPTALATPLALQGHERLAFGSLRGLALQGLRRLAPQRSESDRKRNRPAQLDPDRKSNGWISRYVAGVMPSNAAIVMAAASLSACAPRLN
jgi:hypothetical protein